MKIFISHLAVLFVTMIMLSASCNRVQILQAGAYSSWVQNPENGLLVKKQIGEIEYSIQYKPLDFVILQSNGKAVNKSEAQILKKEFDGMEYFTFRLKSLSENDALNMNSDNEGQYNLKLEHFINNVQDDFKLVDGQDTIPCSLCQYERDYGITPYQTFSLGFNKVRNSPHDLRLIYSDQVMGTGPVSITIESGTIKNIPQLQYQ